MSKPDRVAAVTYGRKCPHPAKCSSDGGCYGCDEPITSRMHSNAREPLAATARASLPEGISRCWQNQGYHVYMAGPCFDTLEQAVAYKARLDKLGVRWLSRDAQ